MKFIYAFFLFFGVVLAQAADVGFNGTRPAAIIDVRTPQEYAAGHIDGAVNIPYDKISDGIPFVKGLSKDSPILIYCRSGRRSAIARDTLERMGYSRIMDGGGMDGLVRSLKACTPTTC